MLAVVQNTYGSPEILELKEINRPEADDNELLVKVRATSVNAGDLFTVRGSPWLIRMTLGLFRPKNHVPGWDVSGEVVKVGTDVTGFQPGDEVFGAGEHAFAEYMTVDAGKVAIKSAQITFEQAAAIPTAGLTALQGLRDHGNVKTGQSLLINGASGGVGGFAVQIGKTLGAEVSGVCSTKKMEMARSIGADHVIDYTKEDFTRNGRKYDIILDNAASHPFSDFRRVLTPHGKILPNSGHRGMSYVFKGYALSAFTSQIARPWMVRINTEDLEHLQNLVAEGQITPVIDSTFPLTQTAEALAYLESGQVQGKMVVRVV